MQSSIVTIAILCGFCLVYVFFVFLDKQLTINTKPVEVANSSRPRHACASGSRLRALSSGQEGKCFIGPPRLCPNPPPNLNDRIAVDQSNVTMGRVEAENPAVQEGGGWKPLNYTPLFKIAIIIPFRDRHQHLLLFLRHMHPFLQKQLVDYTIYVVEQTKGTKFNRGFLFNVGTSEAMADQHFDCFFFHDVDLVPENEKNLYHCPKSPALFATAISQFGYKVRWDTNFGGVTAMSRADFVLINGFSNRFHGWGAEDDDIRLRVLIHGLNITRLPLEIGRYRSFTHDKAEPNPDRLKLLAISNSIRSREGLNTVNYQLLRRERRRLFTWCLIRPRYID